jgi:hypothetical protein
MAESVTYPPFLKYAAGKLSGYSATTRKVSPMGKDEGIKPGDSVRFVLPANSLVDLRTLKLHFRGTTKSANNDKGVVLFPAPIHGVIDQITTSAGGVQIEATPTGWGQVHKMLDDFTAGAEVRDARRLLENECMANVDPETGAFWRPYSGTHGAGNEEFLMPQPMVRPGDRDSRRPFVIGDFPASFLGTVEPRVLSTALTGDLTVEFRFAPGDVLFAQALAGHATRAAATNPTNAAIGVPGRIDGTTGAPTAGAINDEVPVGATYELDDVFLTVKCLDIGDGQFYSMLKDHIESKPLELPFQHWAMQWGNQTPTTATPVDGTTRMTVNSSSVDWLLGTFVGSDYTGNTQGPGAAQYIATTPYGGAGVAAMSDRFYGACGTSRYYQRGGIDVGALFESTWSVNNVTLGAPQELPEIFATVKDEFNIGGAHGMNPRLKNLEQFAQAFFVCPVRLNMKCSTEDVDTQRIASGLDSRASTVNVLWKVKGHREPEVPSLLPQIWAGCTSVLRISAGRVLDLVQ